LSKVCGDGARPLKNVNRGLLSERTCSDRLRDALCGTSHVIRVVTVVEPNYDRPLVSGSLRYSLGKFIADVTDCFMRMSGY
jgi:hypothetical protein